MLSKVIFQYALQLAQQRDCLPLVPLYLCHLKQKQREALTQRSSPLPQVLSAGAVCVCLCVGRGEGRQQLTCRRCGGCMVIRR